MTNSTERFTIVNAMEVQSENLAKWKVVLKASVYAELVQHAKKCNKTITTPSSVFRGQDIDNWVSNYSYRKGLEKQEFTYNFIGGGFNTECAYSQEEAIAQAKERWGDNPTLRIDEKSFRVNEQELKSLMSNFY